MQKRTWFQCQEREATVPPMVARARELLAKPENDRPSSHEAVCNAIPLSNWKEAPKLESPEVAGRKAVVLETFKRRRRGAPLEPAGSSDRPRAGLRAALTVASDESLLQQATANFAQLRYAAGTSETKDALFRTWSEILRARGTDPLPVTEEKLVIVASILRAAGYRAGLAYLLEARQRHVRCGMPWSEAMDLVLKDCKRVFNRAIGPAKKAGEIKLDWLQEIADNLGEWGNPEGKPEGPMSSLLVWALGVHFVLREAELATVVLASDVVKLDKDARRVTLMLTVSKTDPAGRGARRTLACCEPGSCKENLFCPFWVCHMLVELQVARTGTSQDVDAAKDVPLIGTVADPFAFVEKNQMLEAAKLDAMLIAEEVPDAANIDVEAITGHFMRRSGCKRLARMGYPLDIIKHLSRHSSSAVEGYVEEALEECPLAATRITEFQQISSALGAFRSELDEVRKAQQDAKPAVEIPADVLSNLANMEEGMGKIWQELRPPLVKNVNSRKVHATAGCSFRGSPLDWNTKCGWRWVTAGRNAVACSIVEARNFTCCDKCWKAVPSSDALVEAFPAPN